MPIFVMRVGVRMVAYLRWQMATYQSRAMAKSTDDSVKEKVNENIWTTQVLELDLLDMDHSTLKSGIIVGKDMPMSVRESMAKK